MNDKDAHRRWPTVEQNVACADAYNLLSLLLQFPTLELAEGLSLGGVQTDMRAIGSELGLDQHRVETIAADLDALCLGADKEELRENMRREYTRLFNHPDHPQVPLYEGVFIAEYGKGLLSKAERPRMFVNAAALDAERCYKTLGLRPDGDAQMPGDCMSTELLYLGILHEGCAKCLLEGDRAALEGYQDKVSEFAQAHGSKWFHDFFSACVRESGDVYGRVGAFGLLVADNLLGR